MRVNYDFDVVVLFFTVLGQSSCSPLSYLDHFLNESATGNSTKSNLNDSIDSYDRNFDDNKALSIRKSSFSDFNNTVRILHAHILLLLLLLRFSLTFDVVTEPKQFNFR